MTVASPATLPTPAPNPMAALQGLLGALPIPLLVAWLRPMA